MILMTGFGCRAKEECHAVLNEDLVFGREDKEGIPDYVQLSERITKTRRGSVNDVREMEGRIYADNENKHICQVRTMMEYQSRKTIA